MNIESISDYPEIVGIGASLLDTLMKAERYPKEDTKCPAFETMMQGGGPVATALVAAKKLGARTAYIGNVGDDTFAEMIRNEFIQYGVNISCMHTREGEVSPHSFIILSGDSGSRTCVYNMGTLQDNGLISEDFEILSHAKILHIDGHYLKSAIQGASFAKEHGIYVSYDAGGVYSGIEELIPYADILIPSEEFALKITGCSTVEDALKALQTKYNPRVLVITCGSRGGIFYENERISYYNSFNVRVVDSNGAGDTFHGAFLKAYLDGMNTKECCMFASAASAIKCTGFGARRFVPDYETVINFLRNENSKII